MKYFIAALITIWIIAAVYLYINYVIFHKNFGKAGRKKQSPDNSFDGEYERINIIAADEVILSARLFVPEKGDGEKSVVLCHSQHSCGEKDFEKEMAVYKNQGYNILVIDQRSYGKSDGKLSTSGAIESYDTVFWCKWLDLRFGTGCPILIHGKGMGAFAALVAGANSELPQNVTDIVADSAYESIYKLFSDSAVEKYGFLSKLIIPTVNMLCRSFAGFDMRDFDLKKFVKKIKIPVLYINVDKKIIEKTAKAVTELPFEKFISERGI